MRALVWVLDTPPLKEACPEVLVQGFTPQELYNNVLRYVSENAADLPSVCFEMRRNILYGQVPAR